MLSDNVLPSPCNFLLIYNSFRSRVNIRVIEVPVCFSVCIREVSIIYHHACFYAIISLFSLAKILTLFHFCLCWFYTYGHSYFSSPNPRIFCTTVFERSTCGIVPITVIILLDLMTHLLVLLPSYRVVVAALVTFGCKGTKLTHSTLQQSSLSRFPSARSTRSLRPSGGLRSQKLLPADRGAGSRCRVPCEPGRARFE